MYKEVADLQILPIKAVFHLLTALYATTLNCILAHPRVLLNYDESQSLDHIKSSTLPL